MTQGISSSQRGFWRVICRVGFQVLVHFLNDRFWPILLKNSLRKFELV
jgi:hypothetical protein